METSQPSAGEPSTSRANADPLNSGAPDEPHLGDADYEDTSACHPEPSPDTTNAGRPGQRGFIQPDPLEAEQEPDGEEPGVVIHLLDLQTTQCFVDTLRMASLENSGMQPEDIDNLRDPGPVLDLEDPSSLLRCLRHFINNTSASRAHYDATRQIELLNNPGDTFLSYDQVKRRLRWLSGVVPLERDMCIKSCLAYTGPYSELDICPRCSTSRYFPGTMNPRRRFTTIPIGPVIQAFYGSRDVAEHMHYLERRLAMNVEYAQCNGGQLSKYDDTACGKELLDAWNAGTF